MEKRFEATALNLRESLGGMKARSRDLSTVAQKGDMKASGRCKGDYID